MSTNDLFIRASRAFVPGRLTFLTAVLIAVHAQADTLPSSGTLFDTHREALRPTDSAQPAAPGSVHIESQDAEPDKHADASAASSIKLEVKGFTFTGNREISDAQLQAQVKPYTRQVLDLSGLREAAGQITSLYRTRGYLVARAYLPAQEIQNGQVTIGIQEGVIGTVVAMPGPNVRLRPGMQQRFVDALQPGTIIREQDLERVLLRLSDIAGVSVRAILRPSQQPGAADIVLELSEMTAFTARAAIDNYSNYYTGSNRLTSSVSLSDAFGLGETFTVNSQNSFEGLEIKGVGVQQPLGASGVSIGANYAELEYSIGKNLKDINADGTAKVSSVFLNSSLRRSRDANISFNLSEEHRYFAAPRSTATGTTLGWAATCGAWPLVLAIWTRTPPPMLRWTITRQKPLAPTKKPTCHSAACSRWVTAIRYTAPSLPSGPTRTSILRKNSAWAAPMACVPIRSAKPRGTRGYWGVWSCVNTWERSTARLSRARCSPMRAGSPSTRIHGMKAKTT
jgi:hypothetical protein